MSNLLENCSVCLSNNSELIKSSETDANQIKWGSKLNLCVPQVIWNEDCCICSNCIEKLEIAYTFYHLCLQSYELRKQRELLVVKSEDEESPHDSSKISDFTDKENSSEDENEIKCKSFKSNNFINGNIAKVRKRRCLESEPEICNSTNISFDNTDEKSLTLKEEQDLKTEQVCSNEQNKTTNNSKTRKKSKYPKKCDYCTKYFNRKQHLDMHMRRIHTLEKPYACDVCGEKFTASQNLKVHKNKHTNNRPFVCSSCGKTFSTSSCLYHHTQIHLNKRQYKCNMCEKSFNTTSILRAHKICVHVDPKLWKYPCTFCEKRFPMKSGLTAHIRRHTGEKNFACHICEKRFSDKDMVLKHFRSHTNERLFKCHLCAKEYKARGALNVHLKREHDVGTARVPKPAPKKYVCHVCSKAFVTGNKLEKHIRSHTGERPFSCNICRKKFTDGWYLKVHIRSKHEQEGVRDNSIELNSC